MRTPFKFVVTVASAAALIGFSGCNKEKSTVTTTNMAQQGECGADLLPPNQVVATWNGGEIKGAELDKEIEKDLKKIDEEAKKQKFELRRQYLERMVIQRLVQAEAIKKGMIGKDGGPDEEKWVETEIEGGVPNPSDEELQAFYTQVQDRLPPGTTFEQVKPQLIQAMKQQATQKHAGDVFENLRKQANVKIKLEMPRKQVEAKGPSRGPNDAKVTIVEFSDFECPFCGRAKQTVDKLMQDYAGKVKLVFRQYPLPMHSHAPKAAEAALCAQDQGKFWEMHDQMFGNQRALEESNLKEYAKAIGLDEAKFASCLSSGEKAKIVKEDMAAGEAAGVNSTPTFFINGREVAGAVPEEEFKSIIDEELQGN